MICSGDWKDARIKKTADKETGKLKFPCLHPGCDASSSTVTGLQSHVITHLEFEPHACPYYPDDSLTIFQTFLELQKHDRAIYSSQKFDKCGPLHDNAYDSPLRIWTNKQQRYRLPIMRTREIVHFLFLCSTYWAKSSNGKQSK